jgi:hypothetical protein
MAVTEASVKSEEFLAVVSERLDRMEQEMVAALGPEDRDGRDEISRIVQTLKSGMLCFQRTPSQGTSAATASPDAASMATASPAAPETRD